MLKGLLTIFFSNPKKPQDTASEFADPADLEIAWREAWSKLQNSLKEGKEDPVAAAEVSRLTNAWFLRKKQKLESSKKTETNSTQSNNTFNSIVPK